MASSMLLAFLIATCVIAGLCSHNSKGKTSICNRSGSTVTCTITFPTQQSGAKWTRDIAPGNTDSDTYSQNVLSVSTEFQIKDSSSSNYDEVDGQGQVKGLANGLSYVLSDNPTVGVDVQYAKYGTQCTAATDDEIPDGGNEYGDDGKLFTIFHS